MIMYKYSFCIIVLASSKVLDEKMLKIFYFMISCSVISRFIKMDYSKIFSYKSRT